VPDPVLGRRAVLCAAALATGAFAAGALTGCAGGETVRPPSGTGSAKPGDRIATLDQVPVRGGTLVTLPGNGRLLLVRPTENQVRAFLPICPHAGSTVNPPGGGGPVTCPTHGSQFDPTTGKVERGPATTGLTAVPVTVIGDAVALA
jgi:nitrite reductase/ring-hydroxylating ferredoxin subunit